MIELTPGEKRVLAATDGRSIEEIAEALRMNPRTVKYYSDSLRLKLGCKARRHLIAKRKRYLK